MNIVSLESDEYLTDHLWMAHNMGCRYMKEKGDIIVFLGTVYPYGIQDWGIYPIEVLAQIRLLKFNDGYYFVDLTDVPMLSKEPDYRFEGECWEGAYKLNSSYKIVSSEDLKVSVKHPNYSSTIYLYENIRDLISEQKQNIISRACK